MLVILDLCAGTGAWSEPYREAGYSVLRLDVQTGDDVRLFQSGRMRGVRGVLAAPPCTVFSYARNRHQPTTQELQAALSVVDACLRIVVVTQPLWWALENPINKVRRWLGEPIYKFYQWEFGGAAHKPTGLWGHFAIPQRAPRPRTKSSTFKTARENASPGDAVTPAGFARAFFEANP